MLRGAQVRKRARKHVHFWFHLEGCQPLITQVFPRDAPYIDCDAVLAAQDSLKADFVRHEPGIAPDGTTVEEPFVTLDWTFTFAFMARREDPNLFRLPANAPTC